MQTVRKETRITNPGFNTIPTHTGLSENNTDRLKIRELISWSVCFAAISLLTGLLKFLKVGVTMDSVTSFLFYTSLIALAYVIYRIINFPRNSAHVKSTQHHELN
jgi:hypothetical protein